MKRSRLETLLHDYVAGDLDPGARAEIERRLEHEPETRALLEEVRGAHEALQTLKARREPPVSAADVLPQIQAAIAAQGFEPRPRLFLHGESTRFYRRLAMAATVLFAITAGLFAYHRLNATAAPDVESPPLFLDHRPTAADRGLQPIVDLGRKPDGITAAELLRRLEKLKKDPRELRVTPVYNAVPIAAEVR
ncbi:MAG: hypothetical protein ACYTEZ_18995 [Planctomycetota bacterium]|jgi:hypothetical protein